MKKIKYIIIEERDIPTPILFPEILIHHEQAKGRKIVSAGFLSIGADDNGQLTFQCYGESISLKVKSRGAEDDKIMEYWFGRD